MTYDISLQHYLKMEAFFQESLRTKILHENYLKDLLQGAKLCLHGGIVFLQQGDVLLGGLDIIVEGLKAIGDEGIHQGRERRDLLPNLLRLHHKHFLV